MIKQIIINLRKLSRLLIIALILVVVTIFTGHNKVYADTVYVWYGNVDNSVIEGGIGERVYIDVYLQAPGQVYVADILLVLGADETYIDSLLTHTLEDSLVMFYPFSEWESAGFLEPQGAPPNPTGWFRQSFLGFASLSGDEVPWLHNEIPLRMLRMIAKVTYEPDIFKQTVDAFGPGLNSPQGTSRAGDTLGNIEYIVDEYFCQLDLSGSGIVSGTTISADSQLIENVNIEIIGIYTQYSDTTNLQGEFYISDIMPGIYNVVFSHPNYYDTTIINVAITSSSVIEYDIVLSIIDYGSIYGTVTDLSGIALPGVLVSVLTTDISDITGNDGHYQLLNIPPGTYDISFYLEGYFDSLVADVVVSPGEADSIDAALIIRLSTVMLLYQNYPNPFRTSTNFKFFLPEPAKVTIEVYDILGRKVETVASFQGNAGYNVVGWNAPELVSGVYFYRVQYLDQAVTKSLIKIEY